MSTVFFSNDKPEKKSTVFIFSSRDSYFLFITVSFGEALPRHRVKPEVLSSPEHHTGILR